MEAHPAQTAAIACFLLVFFSMQVFFFFIVETMPFHEFSIGSSNPDLPLRAITLWAEWHLEPKATSQ